MVWRIVLGLLCLLCLLHCGEPITKGLLCRNDSDCADYRCILNVCGAPPGHDSSQIITACQKPSRSEVSCSSNDQCCSGRCADIDAESNFKTLCTCRNQNDCTSDESCCYITEGIKGFDGYFCVPSRLKPEDVVKGWTRMRCMDWKRQKDY